VSNFLMLQRKSNQIVMVIFPFKRIRIYDIIISIMLQDFLFFLSIFIVLEPNLLMVSNRCLDIINDIVNLFIMRFDTAG